MANRNKTEIIKSLQKKGFSQEGGDHHFFVYYARNGKETNIKTKVSRGTKDIGDSLLAKMAKQCQLNKKDFLNLIDCPLDQDAYEKKIEDFV
jgi:predicted RNA binding protein YcfA (HicA-like mRNA interferase family)